MFVAALAQENEARVKINPTAGTVDAKVNAPPERKNASPSGKEVMAATARQILRPTAAQRI